MCMKASKRILTIILCVAMFTGNILSVSAADEVSDTITVSQERQEGTVSEDNADNTLNEVDKDDENSETTDVSDNAPREEPEKADSYDQTEETKETTSTDEEKKEEIISEEFETPKEGVSEKNERMEEATPEKTETIEDTEDPMLYPDTLSIDNTEASVGDIIKFSVRATDNVGLEKVIIEWKNLDNNSSVSWKNMTYNREKDIYEYSLRVTETMVAGHWTVESIGAYDTSSNYNFIKYSWDKHKGGIWDFYIENDCIDSEAPHIDISSLTVSKQELKVGEDMVIGVKATDNIGISSIRVEICKGSTLFGEYYNMFYNESTGFYEYHFKPDKSYVGQCYVRAISAYDAVGNYSIKLADMYEADAIWFIITDEEFKYNCEVINMECISGENVEYSYSFDRNDIVRMRIFDKSIVGNVQQSTSISNTTKGIKGVFTPYKEGRTTVEVFKPSTNEVLKVYNIEVTPKKYSTCIGKTVSGTFLTTIKQSYSVICNNEKLDAEIKMLRYIEITTGTSTTGQYEYGYEVNLEKAGNNRVNIIGDTDKREIILDIEVSEHDFSTEWVIDKETSCNEAGSKSHHCVKCDAKNDITEIPKIEHDFSTEWTVDKEATCTETGSKSHHCSRCGEKKDAQILDALGHNFYPWRMQQFPTYESEGIESRICHRCGIIEERKVPKLEEIHVQITSLDSYNIKMSWNRISEAGSYEVYRASELSGEYEEIYSVPASDDEIITITIGAEMGIPYYYKVRAVYNKGGEWFYGKFSNIEKGKAELYKVTNLEAKPLGKHKVRVSWDCMPYAKGYLIYAQKNGRYGYVGMTTGATTTTFTDQVALDSDYNFYWVFPYVVDKNGKMHPGKCEKYVYAKGVTLAVTNLKAASQSGSVILTWTKSAGAEGYLIYGKTATGEYGYIGMTTKGTTYTDRKASKKEWNFYWVFPYHKDSIGKMIVGGTPKYVYGKAK